MSDTVIEKNGNSLLVRPAARLDTGSAPLLRDELLTYLNDVDDITMDFEQVEYISSAGIRVIMEIYQEMEDKGGKLRLTNVIRSVMAILNLVNLTEVITVEPAEQ